MLRKICSKVFLAASLLISAVVLKRFCYRQTDGFALSKIQSNLSFSQAWVEPSSLAADQKELKIALNQPYHYLAKGAQAYVFLSEDKHTVIKFFRLYHLTPPIWATRFRFPIHLEHSRLRKLAQKKEELEKDFRSYALAYQHLKEETGLLFVHLNKSQHLGQRLTLYDKLNIAHEVDLDQMEFVVQKKATLMYPAMEWIIASQGIKASKKALSSLVRLLVKRCQLGMVDKDPDLNTNFGFIGDIPLQIDVGRFRLATEEESDDLHGYRQELLRITDNFRQWLEQRNPELASYLIQEIETFESM